MNGIADVDELLNKAFRLAYLIIGDRSTAIGIATVAIDNLKVATSVQHKRRSYIPTGGSASRAARTKVALSDVHILQRLVYVESELYERLQEQQEGLLGQGDLIIHFIKHLVRIVIKRNSFYVSLGLSRLLYNYTTSEATDIYNLVVQDPDRMRDDYYYRSRKGQLMNELKERFGNLVKTYRSNQREERFQAQEESKKYAGLVRQCLLRFMPWFTTCVLPADLDPTKSIITPLLFKGADPDGEHSIEINRIHTLLHPRCYARLISGLGFAPPDQQLEIPCFFCSGGDKGPTDDRFDPPGLSEQELDAIKSSLDSKSKRRRGSGSPLRVYVDGIEQARIELAQASSVQLKVDGKSEVIQARATSSDGEESILATHLLAHDESGPHSSKYETVAEGGQKVSFSISSNPAGEPLDLLVTVKYEETKLAKAVLLSLRRLKYRLAHRGVSPAVDRSRSSALALLFLFLIACAAGLFVYLQSLRGKVDQPIVSGQKEGGPPSASDSNRNESNPQQPPTEPSRPVTRPGKEPPGGQIASIPDTSRQGESDATRGPEVRTNPARLLSVKRIYIGLIGEDALSSQVRQALIERLQSSSRFTVVQKSGEADAVLRGTVARSGSDPKKAVVTPILVNIEGEVIWPVRRSAQRYTGDVAEVSDRLSRALLGDIQSLERKRQPEK